MIWVYIVIGAAFGAFSRANILIVGDYFFVATLFVNISGSLLLGMVSAISQKKSSWLWLKYGVGIGFLGSFTTFSTFSVDFFRIAETSMQQAFLYIIITVTLGLLAAFVGILLVERIGKRSSRL